MTDLDKTDLTAPTPTGDLVGWVAGEGTPVLLLHGGPGLGYAYLDDLAAELVDGYRVAAFQQRGLAPSVETGEFTIEEATADVVAVLDALGWDRAYLVGHSWGGHLALHLATSIPDRALGVLSVDPLGGVGDGGLAAFGEHMMGRVTSTEARARIEEINALEEAGEATVELSLESLRLIWPSYFADPATAPPMPPTGLSPEAHGGLFADLTERLPELEAALPSIGVPLGFVHGGASPMPVTASTDCAERVPGAWTEVAPGAGHFVWFEQPGCVRTALDRLHAEVTSRVA
jgi:pimeloyl-ACP methyl ester carboxylesterase